MQCSRCQQDNRDEAKFCRECGLAFGIACATCGSYLRPESKYCDNCGASIPVVAPRHTALLLSASPFFHAPSHLAQSIFRSETSQEGERKQVTVLCSDLKGSTEYIAELDPEDARSLLDPILERMMDAVGRYEGTINQVMGDGIQALFGAPIAYEDHAVRACFAALKMQELIRKYAEEVRRTRGVPLLVRVGLNSGEVVVRSMGSELHMNYSAHGQAVHLAARMEQMAVPGTILMSSQTLHLAQGYVMTRSLGPMLVKGLNAPVLSYELLGAVAVSRLQALARRGLTRFVGRGEEIEQLRHALDLAYARHGQIVALVGEPGVGNEHHRVRALAVTEDFQHLLDLLVASVDRRDAILPRDRIGEWLERPAVDLYAFDRSAALDRHDHDGDAVEDRFHRQSRLFYSRRVKRQRFRQSRYVRIRAAYDRQWLRHRRATQLATFSLHLDVDRADAGFESHRSQRFDPLFHSLGDYHISRADQRMSGEWKFKTVDAAVGEDAIAFAMPVEIAEAHAAIPKQP
jgi:class 3 adenylate cyclase